METTRVDICYRPLRIGWAIQAGDVDAFRQAVRMSFALWGGRFNPIILVDREEEADQLVEVFRVDIVLPVGNSDLVKKFPERYPHLISPLVGDRLFIDGAHGQKISQVLDVHNAMVHLSDTPTWKNIKKEGVRIFTWQPDDPLGDVFLAHFGGLPSVQSIGINYTDMLREASDATECLIDRALPLTADKLDYPTIAYLSHHGLERHYSVQGGWGIPGFFIGDAANIDDLVCHWNLRAADIPLLFVDPCHFDRYTAVVSEWYKRARESMPDRAWPGDPTVWSRAEDIDEACRVFHDMKLIRCRVSDATWNGLNVLAPMMCFEEISTLGAIGRAEGRPKLSFPLNDKPFCGDFWFAGQYLVASVSCKGALYGDEQHTFMPPFTPELNEFYAREMQFLYNRLRIEPERVGLVIRASDTDTYLRALPVADLMVRIFRMAGLASKLSPAGLITKQLISQMGGVQGARAFKIPGVRRLLKEHGPRQWFTRNKAKQMIESKDLTDLAVRFNKDHQNLHIEWRPPGTPLTWESVFSYLVEKGLFRIGTELTCPNCRIADWIGIDRLKQRIVCDLCGHDYDATRKLVVDGEWRYRRSGVLGVEKNAHGAIPVALTLQQLDANLGDVLRDALYSTSLELNPKDCTDIRKCETDFVWIMPRRYPEKTVIILGECKDQMSIEREDFENLHRIADALPRKRFKAFILLSKLSPFTQAEIEAARMLNTEHSPRAILLTPRELEPYHIYERAREEGLTSRHGGTPEDLAMGTVEIYFRRTSPLSGAADNTAS